MILQDAKVGAATIQSRESKLDRMQDHLTAHFDRWIREQNHEWLQRIAAEKKTAKKSPK